MAKPGRNRSARRLLVALDVFHRVVIEAEVVTDLVNHGVAHELGHLLGIAAVLFDRPLIDVDRVGPDIAVGGVAAGEIDAPVEAVEGFGRLDAELPERLLVRPVLHHDGDVADLVLEPPGQGAEGPLDERLELIASHEGAAEARRTRGRGLFPRSRYPSPRGYPA